MKLKLLKLSLCAAAVLGTNACVEEEKKVEEVVQAEQDPKHEFEVDKESGKVDFKAEIVYFGFDDHTLTPEGIERLTALAKYMTDNSKLKLKVQGHCDERGSIEYNLALGQRRAETVAKYLVTVGIGKDRLESISFGEEKPANEGKDEKAWAQNRRADFTFVNFADSTQSAASQDLKSAANEADKTVKEAPEAPEKVEKKVAKPSKDVEPESPIMPVSDQ